MLASPAVMARYRTDIRRIATYHWHNAPLAILPVASLQRNSISKSSGNTLLDTMTNEDFAAISNQLETVQLSVRQTLYDDGSPANDVYFPIDCVISVVTTMNDGSAIETATVGYEGMCGAQVALGTRDMFGRWFCQIPGRAYKMSVADFLRAYESNERWRFAVGRYLQAVIDVLSQSVACNRLHLVSER